MFGEMFGVFEGLTALLATILVSRHGNPLTRILHVVLATQCQRCGAAYEVILVQETPAYASHQAFIGHSARNGRTR